MNSARQPDAGVILINVLVVLALGSAIVVLMFTSQENLMDRSRRAAAATQAEALALGAEASIRAALRQDMIEAPEIDHFQEPWASAAQEEMRLETGKFAIVIEDARGKFDLNVLSLGGLAQQQAFARLVIAVGLPDRVAATVGTALLRRGPVDDLSEIEDLSETETAILKRHVSLLPTRAPLNVNTATETVLGAVLGSPSGARQLVKLRERKGFLTKGDMVEAGIILLNGVGFTSDTFDVISTAEVDETTVTLHSRLMRHTDLGSNRVFVTRRRFGTAAP